MLFRGFFCCWLLSLNCFLCFPARFNSQPSPSPLSLPSRGSAAFLWLKAKSSWKPEAGCRERVLTSCGDSPCGFPGSGLTHVSWQKTLHSFPSPNCSLLMSCRKPDWTNPYHLFHSRGLWKIPLPPTEGIFQSAISLIELEFSQSYLDLSEMDHPPKFSFPFPQKSMELSSSLSFSW